MWKLGQRCRFCTACRKTGRCAPVSSYLLHTSRETQIKNDLLRLQNTALKHGHKNANFHIKWCNHDTIYRQLRLKEAWLQRSGPLVSVAHFTDRISVKVWKGELTSSQNSESKDFRRLSGSMQLNNSFRRSGCAVRNGECCVSVMLGENVSGRSYFHSRRRRMHHQFQSQVCSVLGFLNQIIHWEPEFRLYQCQIVQFVLLSYWITIMPNTLPKTLQQTLLYRSSMKLKLIPLQRWILDTRTKVDQQGL